MLSSCATNKKAVPPPPVVLNAPDTAVTYSCGFELNSFSGQLPCFGDECSDFGTTVTTLHFKTKNILSKNLEKDNGTTATIPGKWQIREDCIIEIHYQDDTQEYYKFHKGINKIERLTASQESFPGTLNKHNYLSKTR